MAAVSQHKIFLVSSLAVAVASAAVFGTLAWRNTRGPHGPVARVTLADAPYTPTATDAPAVKTDTWNQPVAQTRGRDWVYDAFTPPEIFYNARSKHFTVKPPLGASEDAPEEPFGLELASVRPEPFRLQLIGYAGGEGDWRGTFQNVATGEVFLAAAGRRMPNLALSIKQLEVKTVEVKLPESMATQQRIATAVVHDDKTGKDITLTHRERQFTGGLSAFVAQSGEAATREVREGETFTIGSASYRIDKISLAPASVEVTKESPNLSQPDHRTLTPRESDEPAAPADAPTT